MPHFPSLPDDALVKDIYPFKPALFRDWCKVEEAIMRGPSAFSPGDREMMGAYCSRLNDCTYCYSSHSETAILFGVDPAVFEALMEGIDTAPVDEALKPVFRYLKVLTLEPYKITQTLANAVFDAGWSEEALQEAILVCCCYAFMNRLVDGHGLPSDPTLFKARAKRHFEEGYVAQYATETSD